MIQKVLPLLVLVFLLGFPSQTTAKEYGGKWSKVSKAEVSWKLLEHLQAEQKARAERLQELGPVHAVDLSFSNFPDERGKRGERALEKFLRGKSPKKFLRGVSENLRANQNLLYPAEAKALKIWEAQKKHPTIGQATTAKILGDEVTAIKLGVILDSSPSMASVVEKLRKEISQSFTQNHTVEVGASYLWRKRTGPLSRKEKFRTVMRGQMNHVAPWFYADPPDHLNPFKEEWHSPQALDGIEDIETLYKCWPSITRDSNSALLAMNDLLEVDSLFWFSDFKDETEDGIVHTIIERFTERKLRLYLVSTDRKPAKALLDYAEKSGGSYKKKRIR